MNGDNHQSPFVFHVPILLHGDYGRVNHVSNFLKSHHDRDELCFEECCVGYFLDEHHQWFEL